MFIKKNYFLFCLLASLSSMSLGLLAQNKPPAPEDKVLKVFLKTADRSNPQRLVAEWDLASLKKLPQKTFTTRTPWFKAPVTFTGPLVRDVLANAQLEGKILNAVALDDYKSKIPFSDVMNFDAILAHSINGAQLTAKNKGPLFIVYPYDSKKELQAVVYYQRSVWQLKALIVE
jgi:hypothetical protein